MLAEDDALVCDTMRRLLARELGIDLLAEATTGAETLDLVQHHRPHVLVLDHGLPDMTALDVLRQLPKHSLPPSPSRVSLHRVCLPEASTLAAPSRG